MKWLAKSFIIMVVGLCVSTALLIGPLSKQLTELSLFRRGADAKGEGKADSKPGKASHSKVAALHARNEVELQKIVANIRDEFATEVTPRQFSSHHVARDYLERLRLARQAQVMGFELDPRAFGDDTCMRRHLEALRQGREPAATALPSAGLLVNGSSAVGSANPPPRDCVFIYGHKYYRDANGRYVRADGVLLQTSALKPAQRKPSDSPSPGSNDAILPADELPYDLDELLKMLEMANKIAG
ncbi:MAG: hypothetical protein KAV82_02430 [Phycisphaerae bacterium]|nr:hypothetical protein [Phycisphaerae bacterium]